EYDIIVDLGCGTGYLVDLLSRSVKHKRIVGLDICPNMIAFAEQNHKPMDSVQYLVQDLSQSWDSLSSVLKALESKVSLIVSDFVIHWIPDKSRLMHVVSKLLAKNGEFVANYVRTPDALESKVSLIVSDFVIHWIPDKSRLMHVVSKLLAKNGEFVANYVRTPDVMSLLTSEQIRQYNIQLKTKSEKNQLDEMRNACLGNDLQITTIDVRVENSKINKYIINLIPRLIYLHLCTKPNSSRLEWPC
ncbi:unnamed protein product, partial [Medioppia subpectinata]